MTYDLYFHFEKEKPSPKELSQYFISRPYYELTKGQVVYQSEKTGVYFIFNWKMPDDSDGDEEADVSFHLNYLRPRIFALEAEPEVAAFIDRFHPIFEDPQIDGMKNKYSQEGFMRGWEKGNFKAGIQALSSRENKKYANTSLPAAEIERCWRWNFNLPKLDEEINVDVFTPRIRPCLFNGKIYTAIVWPDAIPIALPEVDLLIIRRKNGLKKVDVLIVPYSSVLPHLKFFATREWVVPFHALFYEIPPQFLVDFVDSLPVTKETCKPLPVDEILERELFLTN